MADIAGAPDLSIKNNVVLKYKDSLGVWQQAGVGKTTIELYIPSSYWSNNTCTIYSSYIKAESTIMITYNPSYEDACKEAGIYGYSQADASLGLKCTNTPTATIGLYILVLN